MLDTIVTQGKPGSSCLAVVISQLILLARLSSLVLCLQHYEQQSCWENELDHYLYFASLV